MSISQLNDTKISTVKTVPAQSAQMQWATSLMYGQPNNHSKLNFKFESHDNLMRSFGDLLKERVEVLTQVGDEALKGVRGLFHLDSTLVYEINAVPYTALAPALLPNIIGLKCDIHTYAKKLDVCMDLALNILETELPLITRFVATLVTEKDALTTLRPLPVISELKVHSADVEKEKNELAAMIGHEANKQYINFGSAYYSIGEWKECGQVINGLSQRIKKLNLSRTSRNIEDLTQLVDRLLIRIKSIEVPKQNIDTYSKLIEDSSNNIAFAGAVIHMAEVLIEVVYQHQEVMKKEVSDYTAAKKRK